MNIADILRYPLRRYPNDIAVQTSSGNGVSYEQFHDRVSRLASSLRNDRSLPAGARIVVFMENRQEYPEILFACWHAGLVAVPVNAKLHVRELLHIVSFSDASVVFTSARHAEALTAALADAASEHNCELINVDDRAYTTSFDAAPMAMVALAPDNLAWLFYTSGTTGQPKGAMLSHRNLYAMLDAFQHDVKPVARGQALYHGAPMSHGSGFYILPFVAQGGVQIIPDSGGFRVEELTQCLARHHAVSLFAAPTMVKRMLDRPDLLTPEVLFGLDTIIYGGGPMYLRDLDRALDVFGNRLVEIYGQGESPMTITVLDQAHHQDTEHPRYRQRLASVGVPQRGMAVRIANTRSESLPPGETGEILVQGDAVMLGYWNNPVATAKTVVDGWLHTGDIGHLDADGFLYLTDRSKDVIISGGSNIYPREVEEVLLQHPDVREISVIGVPDPDWGEIVVACVAVAGGVAAADQAKLDAFCCEQLARFKRPKTYYFFDELPKNATGKILKTTLRQRVNEQATPTGRQEGDHLE